MDFIREIAFMKTINIFRLLNHPGACLSPKNLGVALAREWQLKESGAYFKVKKAKQVKLLHFSQSLNFDEPKITLINPLYCIIQTFFQCFIACIPVSYYVWNTCFISNGKLVSFR